MTLIKKFILTALLKNISEALFRTRTRKIVKAQIDNPVAGLSPTPAQGQDLIDDLDEAYVKRETLIEQQLQNSEDIIKIKKKVNDMIVSDWMPDVQKFCNGDAGLAKSYGFGIKGEYDGEAPPPVTVKTSFPSIVNVSGIMHLQATLEIVNSVSQEIVMPDDAKSIDIYEYVGENLPDGNYRKTMQYVGQSSRGKYTAHFDSADAGKYVWLLAAYMPKKKGNSNELCGKVRVMVS
jgi:hypothetical protein